MRILKLGALIAPILFAGGCASPAMSEAAELTCDLAFVEWEDVDVAMVEFAQGVTSTTGDSRQVEESEPWRILLENAEIAAAAERFFVPDFNESEQELARLTRELAASWEKASKNGTRFMASPDGGVPQQRITDFFADFAVGLSSAGATRLEMMVECQELGYRG